jgi:hypothetical protein
MNVALAGFTRPTASFSFRRFLFRRQAAVVALAILNLYYYSFFSEVQNSLNNKKLV